MVAAYMGRFSDVVPVAPEFWCYSPARLLGLPMVDFEKEVPHWQALQTAFRHYACEGWGIVSPSAPDGWPGAPRPTAVSRLDLERYEAVTTIEYSGRTLCSRSFFHVREPSWLVERFIKDFNLDWPVYTQATLIPPHELDWRAVQRALDAVGEDYLLEVHVGSAFIDYAGSQREGGFHQVVIDLADREDHLQLLQDRYIAHMAAKVTEAFANTSARSVFVSSSWSSLSLLSPALWRRWDRPVLEAVVRAAHACGGLVHHHFHGRCTGVLPELVGTGVDCLCPFERPPGGDVTDLASAREALGDRTTFNGNVHTVETLARGTPADVAGEVLEILEAFEGSPRVVVGSGDQVGGETPDENTHAMIETARRYGKR